MVGLILAYIAGRSAERDQDRSKRRHPKRRPLNETDEALRRAAAWFVLICLLIVVASTL